MNRAFSAAVGAGVCVALATSATATATERLLPTSNDIAPMPNGQAARGGGIAASSDPVSGAGFLTFASPFDFSESRNRSSYTLRLVANGQGDVEAMRAAAQHAAANVASASGVSIAVASGTVPDTTPDREPAAGEIVLSLDSTTPCPPPIGGCAGPRQFQYRRADRAGVVNAGRIWIHPDAAGYSVHNQRHLVAHELGHALGLHHFDGVFGGELQVMHSTSYDAETFRTGDRNGLAFLGQAPPVATQRSFDGDAKADLIVGSNVHNGLAVALSDGAQLGVGGSGVWLTGWGTRPEWARVGDVNGDGKADLVSALVRDSRVSVALSTGAGLGASGTGTWLPASGTVLEWAEVGDFDGDGKDDLVRNDPLTRRIAVARSTGGGFSGWSTWMTAWGGGRPEWADVGDFNGDGKDDLIVANPVSNTYAVAISNGSSFGAPGTGTWLTGWGGRPVWARIGDFNGDGKDDLIGSNPTNNTYAVATSDGSQLGAAGSGIWLSGWSGTPAFADVGDFNGDGKDDLIGSDPVNNTYAVATSTGTQLGGPGTQLWLTGWEAGVWAAAG